jgi:hypothetical protein
VAALRALHAKDYQKKKREMTEDRVFDELVALAEELGLYVMPPEVCVAHMRLIPCRKKGGHVYSNHPDDVSKVIDYQRGNFGD